MVREGAGRCCGGVRVREGAAKVRGSVKRCCEGARRFWMSQEGVGGDRRRTRVVIS
jgi:hypothetical protein